MFTAPQWNYHRIVCKLESAVTILSLLPSSWLIAFHKLYWPWGNRLRSKIAGSWLWPVLMKSTSWFHFGPEKWGLNCKKIKSTSPWAKTLLRAPSALIGCFLQHLSGHLLISFLSTQGCWNFCHSHNKPMSEVSGPAYWHSLPVRQEVASLPHKELWQFLSVPTSPTVLHYKNPNPNFCPPNHIHSSLLQFPSSLFRNSNLG